MNPTSSDITPNEIEKGVREFLERMAPVSLALVRMDEPKAEEVKPGIRGSGLLIECNGEHIVVTCAHVSKTGDWGGGEIRTQKSPATSERQIYEIPIVDRRTLIWLLATTRIVPDWDFAWSRLSTATDVRLTTATDVKEAIGTLPTYRGPIDRRPSPAEAYDFIS